MKEKKFLSCLFCVGAAVAFVILGWLLGVGFALLLPNGNLYWVEGLIDMLLAALTLLALWRLKKVHILTDRGRGLLAGIRAGGFLVVLIALLLIGGLIEGLSQGSIQPAAVILGYTFDMFAVGLAEELLFRGLILNVLADFFGRDRAKGVWLTVIVSGAIFGLAHLSNILTAGLTPAAGILQAAAAVGVGIYFGAIYVRCGNLWALICLHAVNDFVALMSTGVWGVASEVEVISSYGPERLLSVALYVGLAVFLLRRKKMDQITGREAQILEIRE